MAISWDLAALTRGVVGQLRIVDDAVAHLEPPDFERATRLDGWRVAELVGHVGTSHLATYLAGEGPCEPLAATKLTPTVVTDVHNADGVVTSVPIGSTVHDVATVSGTQGTPTGSVTFTLFSGNTTCQGEGSTSDSIDLVDGSAASGDATVPVGGLSYIAHYSGDATYLAGDGPCEPLAAGKLSPTIATTLSDTEVLVGSTVHDSATLSGATSDAGGTVTYTVYSDINCTQNPQDAGTADVSGGDVGNSNGIQFNNAGDFYWQAVYSGDANNNGATSPCQSEILTVGKKSPSISTTLSATTGAVGASVHDSSALTGATANAGGTVTYTVYTNDSCTDGAIAAGAKTVTNGVPADSNGVTFNAAGTYYWQAVYSGDANNNGATSPCKSEILIIGKNAPTISTTLSATSGASSSLSSNSLRLSAMRSTKS